MAYRFILHGQNVECDTVAELLAVAQPATPADTAPATKERRARRYSEADLTNASRAVSRGWARARAYAAKNNMTVREARAYLSKHPRAKQAAQELVTQ